MASFIHKKNAITGIQKTPFSGVIPALFRHHLHHHWKCIFWGCNQCHTSPVQAPLAPPFEVHFLRLQPAPFQAPYQPRSGTTCRAIGSAIFRAATNAISRAIPTPFQASFRADKRCPLGAPFRRYSQRLKVTNEALLAGDAGSRKAPMRLFMPLMQAAPWLAGDEAVHKGGSKLEPRERMGSIKCWAMY